MGTRTTKTRAFRLWSVTILFCWTVGVWSVAARAEVAAAGESAGVASHRGGTGDNDDGFDEDQLVQETIAAGRGDREEQGIRDQWLSDEHLGKESLFDSRKPVSAEVRRYLDALGLDCEGCDHDQATRRVNAYLREQKRQTREREEARERRDALARRLFATLVVAGLAYAYVHRRELGLEAVFQNGRTGSDAELARARQRHHAAEAAARRQQQQQQHNERPNQPPPPTWLENEQKEVWTAKQEKQFQTALREFSGIPKKERYKLIAEKVQGKSRIECLTHHRMQELLRARNQPPG